MLAVGAFLSFLSSCFDPACYVGGTEKNNIVFLSGTNTSVEVPRVSQDREQHDSGALKAQGDGGTAAQRDNFTADD